MATPTTFPAGKGIVCFGDSITLMAATRADRGYPSILDELLFDRGVSVGNNGVSGGGFQNAQDAYDFFHKSRGLWGACVLVGVNDIAAGLDAATIFTGINKLVTTLLADGLRVVISTVLPWKNGGGWTSPRQTITEAVNVSIRALAGTHPNLRVVDGYAEFGQVDDPQLLQRGLQEVTPDFLHLGSYGAQAFARLMAVGVGDLLSAASGTLAPSVGIQPEALAARALRDYLLRWLPAKVAQLNALRGAVVKSAAVGPLTIASGALVLASAREGATTSVTLPTGTVTAAAIATAINAAAVPGVTASADGEGRLVLTGAAPTEGVLSCVSVRAAANNLLFGWPEEGCYDVVPAITAPTFKGVMDGGPATIPDFGRTFAVVIGDRSAVEVGGSRADMHAVTLDVSVWVADRASGGHRTRETLQACVRAVRELLDSDDGRTLGRGTVGDILRVQTAAKLKGTPFQVFDQAKVLVASGEVASLTVTVKTFHRPSLVP
jgi:lysophospholipase L1-like esterase